MTGSYWLLRHPSLPGKVCVIREEDVNETPALLDLPGGMAFENVEIVSLEWFLAAVKRGKTT